MIQPDVILVSESGIKTKEEAVREAKQKESEEKRQERQRELEEKRQEQKIKKIKKEAKIAPFFPVSLPCHG